MIEPVAVLISDIHYSLPTLALADAALGQAIDKANELQVPLIIAGDLHDTKANLRGECIKAMRATLARYMVCLYNWDGEEYYHLPLVLIGNHDRINEKSEDHALECISDLVQLVTKPTFTNNISVKNKSLLLVPYQHDIQVIKDYCKSLSKLDRGSTIIMHQGISGSNSGDYIQDKTAITQEDVAGFRVVSGHYHTRQTIALLGGGQWDYIGNPYTLNFAEANDPPKGFQVLMNDGSLQFVPTNLRRHVVIDCHAEKLHEHAHYVLSDDDLLLVKLRGTQEELLHSDREGVELTLNRSQFRLDLIPDEMKTGVSKQTAKKLEGGELLDSLIDSLNNASFEQKCRLKDTWKGWK